MADCAGAEVSWAERASALVISFSISDNSEKIIAIIIRTRYKILRFLINRFVNVNF